MRDVKPETQKLARDVKNAANALTDWARRHHGTPADQQIRPMDQLLAASGIGRVEEALGWGASVGLYGESQCGKSNLVSRFAMSLGADDVDGNLCVADPGNASGEEAPQWRVAGVKATGVCPELILVDKGRARDRLIARVERHGWRGGESRDAPETDAARAAGCCWSRRTAAPGAM